MIETVTDRLGNVAGKACIVGAGASGIAAAKALQEREIGFDWFEKRDRIGGVWALADSDETSPAYRSLHINTSKRVTGFSDYPLAAELPDFPHRTDIDRYLNSYVDQWGLRDRISFGTEVERAELIEEGGAWEVTPANGEKRRYDWLLVASGHNEQPRWPKPPVPGTFSGQQMHSCEYLDPTPMRGKRMVVVGFGNTAVDIAVECSYVADSLILSCWRGAHVIPRYVLGKPADHYPDSPWLPFRLRRLSQGVVRRLILGSPAAHGLPAPGHRFGQASPTISSTLLPCLAEGRILTRRGLVALDGEHAVFADGTRDPADVIVYCTGYEIAFPFFDPAVETEVLSQLPLHLRMFAPGLANAAFIGLVQQWGPLFPVAEAQGEYVAALISGELRQDDAAAQRRQIERERRRIRRRYVSSTRHEIMLDTGEYLRELKAVRRRAVVRRSLAGRPLLRRERRLADAERA